MSVFRSAAVRRTAQWRGRMRFSEPPLHRPQQPASSCAPFLSRFIPFPVHTRTPTEKWWPGALDPCI